MSERPIKICTHCGWKYDYAHPGKTCRICHEPMKQTRCYVCGAYVPVEARRERRVAYCKDCYKDYQDRNRKAMNESFVAKYDAWLARIAKVPTPYHTLTDEEWLKACMYFGGCALCNSDEISARGFFLPFEVGGRYCDWNVIPLCQKCATTTKLQPNIWKRIGNRQSPRIRHIIAYLEPILEERIHESEEITGI